MNFLAHFHLAWPNPGLVAGALEGDYLKGPLRGDLRSDLEAGVRLHRAVDAYTDQHPVVCELRSQFPRSLRRYAGILIDLGFDHYLTLHWQQFGTLELTAFNQEVYRLLQLREDELGPGARRMLARLLEYDILNRYHHWDTVTGTAERIGSRLRRGNALAGSDTALTPLRPQLEAAFLAFYPDLLAFGERYRAQLNQSGPAPSKVARDAQSP